MSSWYDICFEVKPGNDGIEVEIREMPLRPYMHCKVLVDLRSEDGCVQAEMEKEDVEYLIGELKQALAEVRQKESEWYAKYAKRVKEGGRATA